jgi:hypothetical protein
MNTHIFKTKTFNLGQNIDLTIDCTVINGQFYVDLTTFSLNYHGKIYDKSDKALATYLLRQGLTSQFSVN